MRWILPIVMLSLCSGCLSVVHKNFTMPLNGYVKNNSLKMNGYYIHFDTEDVFRVFQFYDNGVAFYTHMGMGYLKGTNVDSFIYTHILKDQTWISDGKNRGGFRISDNKIGINIIQHTNYEMHRVVELQGTILTDTSFMITSDYLPKVYPRRNDTLIYHFVPGPKPDSAKNNWLMHRKWYRGK